MFTRLRFIESRGLVAVAATLLALAPHASSRSDEPALLQEGRWRAWLDSPGGDLPFSLELKRENDAWSATIRNGAERIDVPVVAIERGELTLGIDYYDSSITARVSHNGTRLDGHWKKKGRGDQWSTLPFHAESGVTNRFGNIPRRGANPVPRACNTIAGRWSVEFERSDEPAIGLFDQNEDGTVTGTFLTTTGDYRFLEGRYDSGLLRLSAFDGAHAFLFRAACQVDGTLTGDFWSRDAWHESWTARRDPNAALPDAFTMTKPTGRVDLTQLRFPDVDGVERSLSDARFSGKAYIIDIFGTWCPNCFDASNYLNELHARYHTRGLSIVGLAFELTGDFARDARQVKRYAARHNIAYPILIAGDSVRERVAQRVPVIDQLRAYPTLIFIDARGNIRGVYTGFAGPATGDAHAKLRRDIESLVESMLAG